MRTRRISVRYFNFSAGSYSNAKKTLRRPHPGRVSYNGGKEIGRYVRDIIDNVAKRGDEALIEYEAKFDGVNLRPKDLRVGRSEVEEAYGHVSEEQISSIKFSKKRVERVESHLLKRLEGFVIEDGDFEGTKVELRVTPLKSVGCYVPGGTAVYPSSLVMSATPALVAGVERIVVCSPPSKSKIIDPLVLVAGDICGVKEFYKVGGAQAIGALAFGTRTIPAVEKIVGPGSKFVTQAKIVVSESVPIDLPAGPSELLVLADETADPEYIVADMISQSEHSEDSICGLMTTSKVVAKTVLDLIPKRAENVERGNIVRKALAKNGFVVYCSSMDRCVRLANDFAPEHLEILSRDAAKLAERITTSGIVLLGPNTPAAASDYTLGTNHVLPTGGFATKYSNLSSLDFVRRFYIAECSRAGLSRLAGPAKIISRHEGLVNHYLSIERRLR
ncbi:MAG: histidinol dehydrogenase [Nitrososphaerales archaeon]